MQDERINILKQTITEMESQKEILVDAIVEAALIPLRQKLADLEAQVDTPREEPPQTPTRQRKLVTLLFIDVVYSTKMTQHLDPEDSLEIIGDALAGWNSPGDLELAREIYQQSLDMFTEMGAPGYIKVLEEQLEEMKN